jgi:hypothetical protein
MSEGSESGGGGGLAIIGAIIGVVFALMEGGGIMGALLGGAIGAAGGGLLGGLLGGGGDDSQNKGSWFGGVANFLKKFLNFGQSQDQTPDSPGGSSPQQSSPAPGASGYNYNDLSPPPTPPGSNPQPGQGR